MEQTFTDQIPNIKPNPDGSWPQSAKHKAPRYEVPSGTDLVETEFNLNLGERPGPGRVYIIGLMSGPIGQAHPIGSLAIGADDQWLVTGHPEIQEPGKQRVRANWLNPYRIVMVWDKDHSEITYTVHQGNKLVHQITIPSSLDLDSGGRVLVGQDVKNPKRLKDLHSLPPFGSTISGTIRASDMDVEEPDDDNSPIEPRPIDPLPPIVIKSPSPSPVTPPPVVTAPPVNLPPPPITIPSLPPTIDTRFPPPITPPPKSGNDKVLGLERSDLILILRSVLASFERGEDIDLRSILAQVLAPILLSELLGRR